MADTDWASAVDGNFADPAKWTSGAPVAGIDALINVAGGDYTVTVDSAVAFDSLTIARDSAVLFQTGAGSMTGQALTITSGTVRIAGVNALDAITLRPAGVLILDNHHAIDGSDLTLTGGVLLAEVSTALTGAINATGEITFAAADDARLVIDPVSFSSEATFHFGTADHAGKVVWTGPQPQPGAQVIVDYGTLRLDVPFPSGGGSGPTLGIEVAAGATVSTSVSQRLYDLRGEGRVVVDPSATLTLGGNPFGGGLFDFDGSFSNGANIEMGAEFDLLLFSGVLRNGHITMSGGGVFLETNRTQGTIVTLDNNNGFGGAGHNPFNLEKIEMKNLAFISSSQVMGTLDDHFELIGQARLEFFASGDGGFDFTGGSFETNGFSYTLSLRGHITGSGDFYAAMLEGATSLDVRGAFGDSDCHMRDLGAVSLGPLFNDGEIDARGTDLTLSSYSHHFTNGGSIRATNIFLDGTDNFDFRGPSVIGMLHVLHADTDVDILGGGRVTIGVEAGASAHVHVGSEHDAKVTVFDFDDDTTEIELDATLGSDQLEWHARRQELVYDNGFARQTIRFADPDITLDNLEFSDFFSHLLITYTTGSLAGDGLLDAAGG